MEYTIHTVQQTLGITKKNNNLGYFTKSALDCFTLMFRNEHRSNLIFFLAWHVLESHLLKEESSLIILAKKLICIGEKFVPQPACLSSHLGHRATFYREGLKCQQKFA